MLAAIDWLLEHWEAIASIGAIALAALEWIRRRVRKILDVLGTTNNKLGDIATVQTHQAEAIATLTQRMAGMMARQRHALNRDPTPIFETNLLGEFEFANRALLDLLDWPLDDLRGSGWQSCIYVEDRARAVGEVEEAVDGKRFAIVKFRVVARNETIYAVTCFVEPLICEARMITGFSARFTERKRVTP